MRPFLLVLTVVFKPDVRSMVKTVVDQTGHRMVESGGYGQALLFDDSYGKKATYNAVKTALGG